MPARGTHRDMCWRSPGRGWKCGEPGRQRRCLGGISSALKRSRTAALLCPPAPLGKPVALEAKPLCWEHSPPPPFPTMGRLEVPLSPGTSPQAIAWGGHLECLELAPKVRQRPARAAPLSLGCEGGSESSSQSPRRPPCPQRGEGNNPRKEKKAATREARRQISSTLAGERRCEAAWAPLAGCYGWHPSLPQPGGYTRSPSPTHSLVLGGCIAHTPPVAAPLRARPERTAGPLGARLDWSNPRGCSWVPFLPPSPSPLCSARPWQSPCARLSLPSEAQAAPGPAPLRLGLAEPGWAPRHGDNPRLEAQSGVGAVGSR